MSWWGKMVGGAFGYLMGGPLGALLGAAMGHQFDAGLDKVRRMGGGGWDAEAIERTQSAFFTATFSVMGHIAKADGRVSKDEIDMARAVMGRMQLDASQREVAIRLFTEGKADDFPLDEVLEQFRRECHRRHTLIQMFLEIQLQAAYADGVLHPQEREVMIHIFEGLGFSAAEFEHLDAVIRGAAHFGGEGARARQAPPSRDRLAEAYAILGVEASAEDVVVKRAYKRMMSQHHPDKLVAKGLPEEMMKLATEKTQEIKAAYEAIKQSRGMR